VSDDIQNEVQIWSHQILKAIVKNVSCSNCIIADEATVMSLVEQVGNHTYIFHVVFAV